jgi:nucleolar protein 53
MDPKFKRRKTDWVSNKELLRLKSIAYTAQPVLTDPSQENETANHDPWAISPPKPTTSDQDLPLGPKPKPAVPPKSIKRAPEPQTASGKQVRAIPNPKAGTSYNPVFRDWDELLLKEGEKEVAAERQRLVDEALEKENQARIAAAQAEVEVPSDDDESAWEGIESEHEGEFHLSTKRPERKTPSQRNRVIRRKEAKRKEKHERQMKKRRAQQEQIREIAKKMEEIEKEKGKVVKMEVDEGEDEVDDEVLKRRRGKPTYVLSILFYVSLLIWSKQHSLKAPGSRPPRRIEGVTTPSQAGRKHPD